MVKINTIHQLRKNAQATLTYAALIVVIVAVLLAMSSYIKRSFQGRYKQAGDVYGGGFIYSPDSTDIIKDVNKKN